MTEEQLQSLSPELQKRLRKLPPPRGRECEVLVLTIAEFSARFMPILGSRLRELKTEIADLQKRLDEREAQPTARGSEILETPTALEG